MARAVVRRGQKHLIEWDDMLQQHVATFTIHDQHYRDASDQWQPVNESLINDGADGFAKKCETTRHILRLGNGGTRRWYPRRNVTTEYVGITAIEYWRTTGGGSWRPINLPTPVWRGNGADWDLTNLSASLTNTWRRIKADFVLKDATAPTRLRFAVTLVGLTLGADWHLTSTTDSVDVGSIDPPIAEDANGASVPVTATYAGGYVEWSVDPIGATYPVTVDPTFTDGPGGDVNTAYDAYIQQSEATSTHNNAYLYLGDTDTADARRTLIKFDLSSLSQSAPVTSATLSLYLDAIAASNNRTARVYRCKRNWVEAQTTWNVYSTGNNWQTAGGFGVDDCEQTDIGTRTLTTGDAAGYKDWSLSGATIGDLSLGYGYLMKVDTETQDAYRFYSSDAAGSQPTLVVVYTEGRTTKNTRSHPLGIAIGMNRTVPLGL